MFIDIKFSFCKFLFIEQRHSELVLAIGIYLLWSFRDSFSNFNIIISYKDENTSKGILRVMYGMYEGGSFMGKGFGIWLSVRILWKPLSEDFFSPFCSRLSLILQYVCLKAKLRVCLIPFSPASLIWQKEDIFVISSHINRSFSASFGT